MTFEIDSDLSNYDDIWDLTQRLATDHAAYWRGRIITQEDALICSQDIAQSVFKDLCNRLSQELNHLSNLSHQSTDTKNILKNLVPLKLSSIIAQSTSETHQEIFEYIDSLSPKKDLNSEDSDSFSPQNQAIETQTIQNTYVPSAEFEQLFDVDFLINHKDWIEKLIGEPLEAKLQRLEESWRNRSLKPSVPFKPQATERLGDPNQPTVNFHCGINNSYETTSEEGACLYQVLDGKLAVQPHWIHKDSLTHGISMVALESVERVCSEILESPFFDRNEKNTFLKEMQRDNASILTAKKMAQEILIRSNIEKSIKYEVEVISNNAKAILEQNNPNLKQVHVVFSNAGHVMNEALKRLPEEYRNTIILISAGSTVLINKKSGCHKVYNIVGDQDSASQTCIGKDKLREALETGEVRIIKQTETKAIIKGHYSIQPEYLKEISNIIDKEITKEYEIY